MHLTLESTYIDIWRIPLSRQLRPRFNLDAPHEQSARNTIQATLRFLIASYLNIDEREIEIRKNFYGKPELPRQFMDHQLQLNLSHSKNMLVMAFARNRRVGIDIEYQQPNSNIKKIVNRFFSEKEKTEFNSIPRHQQLQAFYNGWTRKEAYVKAIGLGLYYPLHNFDVTLSPDLPAQLLSVEGNPEEAKQWYLSSFSPAYGYSGALVVESLKGEKGVPKINFRREFGGP